MHNHLWKNKLFFVFFFGMLLIAFFFVVVNVSYAQTVDTEIPSPTQSQNFPQLVNAIAGAIRQIAIPFAVVAIIIAGLKLIVAASGGDPKGVSAAKKMLGMIFLGTAIVVGATALAQAIIDFAREL